MQIKRLLDDQEVFAGVRVFDAQRRSYRSLVHDASEGLSLLAVGWSVVNLQISKNL